jgi:hypothetical protein
MAKRARFEYVKEEMRDEEAQPLEESSDEETDYRIRIATDDEIFELCVWSYDTIGYVKSQIEHEQNIPVAQQRLVFPGQTLEDEWTLAYYAIEADDIVTLVTPKAAPADEVETTATMATGSSSSSAPPPAPPAPIDAPPAIEESVGPVTQAQVADILLCLDNLHERLRRVEQQLRER